LVTTPFEIPNAAAICWCDILTPWGKLHRLVEPFYPKVVGAGCPPIGLTRMLRMYVAQAVTLFAFANLVLAGRRFTVTETRSAS
jgi:hypothetical protein